MAPSRRACCFNSTPYCWRGPRCTTPLPGSNDDILLKMAKVMMVASEATPFSKTGGLADVMGALPPALTRCGESVAVVTPRYATTPTENAALVYRGLAVVLGPASYTCDILRVELHGAAYFLVDCPPLYGRDALYGSGGVDYPDNHIRFGVLSKAALAIARWIWRPDVIHCHDWQAGLVPVFLSGPLQLDPTFAGVPTIITIHNLAYQGLFPPAALDDLGLDRSWFRTDRLEFFGKVNLLKGALVLSDAITTVSERYAQEIQTPEFGSGLEGLLAARSDRIYGILNGVDYSSWDPAHDPHIPAAYSHSDLAGKQASRRELLRQMGLSAPDGRAVLGIVSRLAEQKGFDLIASAAPELLRRNVALAVLGSGDPVYEKFLRDLSAAHPDQVAVGVGWNEPLAHLIEAGSDIFLMPSRYEPCGLNQMYSLRYGTVPVVHATGGLDDTIDDTTGFKFREYSPQALLAAIDAALLAFEDKQGWTERMRRGMQRDFSWDRSAREYARLYRSLLSNG